MSIEFWLKYILHYIKGGYLQVLLVLYILYSAILQYLFFLMNFKLARARNDFFFSNGVNLMNF
jgi:hypothetical protein